MAFCIGVGSSGGPLEGDPAALDVVVGGQQVGDGSGADDRVQTVGSSMANDGESVVVAGITIRDVAGLDCRVDKAGVDWADCELDNLANRCVGVDGQGVAESTGVFS